MMFFAMVDACAGRQGLARYSVAPSLVMHPKNEKQCVMASEDEIWWLFNPTAWQPGAILKLKISHYQDYLCGRWTQLHDGWLALQTGLWRPATPMPNILAAAICVIWGRIERGGQYAEDVKSLSHEEIGTLVAICLHRDYLSSAEVFIRQEILSWPDHFRLRDCLSYLQEGGHRRSYSDLIKIVSRVADDDDLMFILGNDALDEAHWFNNFSQIRALYEMLGTLTGLWEIEWFHEHEVRTKIALWIADRCVDEGDDCNALTIPLTRNRYLVASPDKRHKIRRHL